MKDIKNYNLLNHNTFGISGNCRRFVEFDNVDELQTCVRSITAEDKPLLIIGGGSNLLLTRDFPGLVLHSAIMGREVVKESDGKVWLRCGSGETWDDIVAYAVEKDGMEQRISRLYRAKWAQVRCRTSVHTALKPRT